jgi:hypothetical protein
MGYFLLSCAWPSLSKPFTTTALDISEVLLLVFGAVLTVGALGEYKKFPRLLTATLATFELMVVIGIAGELLADGAIFVFSRHLQTLSEGEYATLNDEAGKARKEAGESDERSKKLEEANLILQSDLLKLKIAAEPRRLTGEQKKTLTNILRDKTAPIFILPQAFDAEATDFANDIGDAMNKAGWKTFFGVRTTHERGIEVGTSKESNMAVLMPEIERVKRALSAVGFSSRITLFDPQDQHLAGRFEKNVLCLVIDHKPEMRTAP